MKNILGSISQTIITLVIGGLISYAGQKWLHSDLEYKVISTDAYLSAPLGQQGLTMAFKGKPLKNVSIVEFSILNRTSKPFKDTELEFLVDKKAGLQLVSSDIITPRRISKKENIENLPSTDPNVRKFKFKIVPTQQDYERFSAVFMFAGEKAPHMSVISKTAEVSVIPYEFWKDLITQILIISVFYLLVIFVWFYRLNFVSLPRMHKKKVESFVEFTKKCQDEGQINADPQFLEDARKIFELFTKPKLYKFGPRFLSEKHLEDKT